MDRLEAEGCQTELAVEFPCPKDFGSPVEQGEDDGSRRDAPGHSYEPPPAKFAPYCACDDSCREQY